VILIVGLVAFGGWLQSARDDDKITEKNLKITNLTADKNRLSAALDQANQTINSDKDKLTASIDKINQTVQSAGGILQQAQADRQALESKTEFLERYLSYNLAPESSARQLFINYVCALWKGSEERKVGITQSAVDLTPAMLQSGLSPELRDYLLQHGISDLFIQRASSPVVSRSPFVSPVVSPTPQEAIATIQKQVSNLTVIKIVHFYDGTSYQVPEEIALAVHTQPSCAPR
jgi:hypothetical protein